MTRIAINGFGRIGRLFFRQITDLSEFEVVAINDLGDVENLEYLLKYDTVYGKFNRGLEGMKVLQEKDPVKLPWKELGVDIVVESTGAFESYELASLHLKAGAKRVVLTAPARQQTGLVGGEEIGGKTVLMGINEDDLKSCTISSNGSCTTNAAAPVVQVLSENPGIKKAILNTVHGYTATQNLVDGPVKGSDVRRGRAAGQNIVPSSTGAAIAVTRAVKELEGKFDGIAMRVPIVAGSIADITFVAKRKTSVEEINKILEDAAALPKWKGIFKVTKDPIVSSDIIGEPYGAIIDLSFTRVIDGDLVKVLSWYDNEWGYASTLVKHVEVIARTI